MFWGASLVLNSLKLENDFLIILKYKVSFTDLS